jgi:hypothetical protein
MAQKDTTSNSAIKSRFNLCPLQGATFYALLLGLRVEVSIHARAWRIGASWF